MLMLYFSGTGNSKYIANLFSKKVNAKCYSIEENIDFKKEIKRHNTIAFCYPIYASNVPRIMREFVSKYVEELKDKTNGNTVNQEREEHKSLKEITEPGFKT